MWGVWSGKHKRWYKGSSGILFATTSKEYAEAQAIEGDIGIRHEADKDYWRARQFGENGAPRDTGADYVTQEDLANEMDVLLAELWERA